MTTTDIIRKSFTADFSLAEGERSFIAKITSDSIDGEGDVLLPSGMDAKDFELYPIVFWNHEYTEDPNAFPIGHVVSLKRMADHWIAKVKLDARPAAHVGEWVPDTILSKIQQGTIRGVSVGFNKTESRNPTAKDRATFGESVARVISKWKLRELSIAALPMNKDAAILAVSKANKRAAAPVTRRVIVLSYTKAAAFVPPLDIEAIVNRAVGEAMLKRRGRLYA